MHKVLWDKRVAKDLRAISPSEREALVMKADQILANNPYVGLALKGNYRGFYRIRLGDYRVIYTIQAQEITVRVIKVGHRKEVYE